MDVEQDKWSGMMTATYSPEDNKLRLYTVARLPSELYERVRAAGFIWAPRQDLFVAPKWTPAREDLLIELCGEIDDEDTSLMERQNERAERAGGYSEKQLAISNAAGKRSDAMAYQMNGQPILVGHHSEKRHRRAVARMQNLAQKCVEAWRTSEYWQRRAAAAIAHARHKLRPDVRRRRIKKLEADRRRLEAMYTPQSEPFMQVPYNSDEPCLHVIVGQGRGRHPTPVAGLENTKRAAQRWIEHLNLRLEYECAMLTAEGHAVKIEKPKRALAPLLNYRQDPIETRNRWQHGEVESLQQVEVKKAEYARLDKDHKSTRESADRTHRIRIAMLRGGLVAVFLSDVSEKRPGQ